jgi:hypothetical protein
MAFWKVKPIKMGYYKDKRRRVIEEEGKEHKSHFVIDEKEFSSKWMEIVSKNVAAPRDEFAEEKPVAKKPQKDTVI